MEETEERPDEGPYLEIWMDIPDVGEPMVRYWHGGPEKDIFRLAGAPRRDGHRRTGDRLTVW
jgi:hypothetical protein